jgi:hypothetical protein
MAHLPEHTTAEAVVEEPELWDMVDLIETNKVAAAKEWLLISAAV